MTITLFDTYTSSLNSGDAIIMDAIKDNLNHILPFEYIVTYPTHYPLSKKALKKSTSNSLLFVGGTNLLNSFLNFTGKKNQWSIGYLDSFYFENKAILMGCGWNKYQNNYNFFSKQIYKNILSKKYLHSVRDSYSQYKLSELGVKNVLNTGCPTLWKLTNNHCSKINKYKSTNVLFTLTDYSKNFAKDSFLVSTLLKNYNDVYFWIQGANDLHYLKELNLDKLPNRPKLITSDLKQLNCFLEENKNIDYIGTRLHAGIKAMHHQCRSIIIAIDNRAIEMAKDFNLNIILREELEQKLDKTINSEVKTEIKLPDKDIALWLDQFN